MHPHRGGGFHKYSGRSQPYCRPEAPSWQRPVLSDITNFHRESSNENYFPREFAGNFNQGYEEEPQYYERGYYSVAPYTEMQYTQIPEFAGEVELNVGGRYQEPSVFGRNQENNGFQRQPPMDGAQRLIEKLAINPSFDNVVVPKKVASTSVALKMTRRVDLDQEDESTVFKRREAQTTRLLTGTVQKILEWAKIKDCPLLFEVIGNVEGVKSGSKGEKYLLLRDGKTGPGLQVVFYEIDRKLPEIHPGTIVKCVGNMLERNKMQAFKVLQSTNEEKLALQHVTFLCNRVVQEITTK